MKDNRYTHLLALLILTLLASVVTSNLQAQAEPDISDAFILGPFTSVACTSIKFSTVDPSFDVSNLEVRVERIRASFKQPHNSAIEITTPLMRKVRTNKEGVLNLSGLKAAHYILRSRLNGKEAFGTIDFVDSQISKCVADLQVWPAKGFIAIGGKIKVDATPH